MKAVKTDSDAKREVLRVIDYWRRSWHPQSTYAELEKAKLQQLETLFVNEQLWADSLQEPVYLPPLRKYLYQNCLYRVDAPLTHEQKALLVKDAFDAERRKFERLKNKFSDYPDAEIRTKIPEQVRIEVWRRDGGACANCGSRERLEYDHIIPVSKGGSSTARNIELLCESCNRAKRAEIQ